MTKKYIRVELAVGWEDFTWSDGHYVYVPEDSVDPVDAAIEKLTAEFNAVSKCCAFITDYSIEKEQRFSEDGNPFPRVSAEAHSDDHACEVTFDATPYFEQASDEDLFKLAVCGWGGDYPADTVAIFMADQPGQTQLTDLFKYLEIARRAKDIGFECHVDAEEAMVWMEANRPAVTVQVKEWEEQEK